MDDDDNDVVCIGTPLEELDEDDVRIAKAPRVEDQIVTDKQGRRRFHGAFTGGFSAGYFNSVGTKEGWTPSAFVSSKGQRSEAKQSKPQDFMDDEDLESFGIAPQGIQTSADYDRSEQVKRKRVNDPSGPIPGTPVLEELLRPTRDTMGMKLLRQLGWRPGQGVGPRVSRKQKASAKREKKRLLANQGKTKDGGSESDDSDDSEDDTRRNITYAPCDVPELSDVTPKMDVFGLGYTPLSRVPVLGGHINLFDSEPFSLKEKKKKLLIKGQAFGVGAFEDEDEDIYATEDMSNYDFGEDKEDKEKQNKQAQHNMTMLGIVKALDGFRLSSQPLHQNKTYPPPSLPSDFIPLHKPRRRRFERKESELRGLGRHAMTAEHRAHIMADQSKAIVEIRSGIKGQNQPPPSQPSKDTNKTVDTSEIDKIYEEFKNSDRKLGSDFKPFASVPEKQKRYDLFLRMKEKGQKERFYLAQPKSMTEWEREREVQEFIRAAKLFQPLVSSMATRFVTAATSESDSTLKDGLNTSIPKGERREGKEGLLDPVDPGDERTAAARSGMYGTLTQTKEDWHPDSLLCRRFNVPNPYPDSSFVGTRKTKKEKAFQFGIHDTEETAGLRTSRRREKEGKEEKEEEEQEEQIMQQGELNDKPEDYGLKIPVDGPPTMDLFKAIFQDSDSDSDSDKEQNTTKTDENTANTTSSLNNKTQDGSSEMRTNTLESVQQSPTTTTTTTTPKPRQRVSRFEPVKEDLSTEKDPPKPSNQPEDIAKHSFIPRRKDEQSAKSGAVAHGIFANVDLVALNSYRNQRPETATENDRPKHTWPESVINARLNAGSERTEEGKSLDEDRKDLKGVSIDSSSTDSDDLYGPPLPSHLKNRPQVIQSTPVPQLNAMISEAKPSKDWIEKAKSRGKHRHKSRSKTRKKKKKGKKHKEKKKKDRRSSSRRSKPSSSSSNSSDRSDSSSDSS